MPITHFGSCYARFGLVLGIITKDGMLAQEGVSFSEMFRVVFFPLYPIGYLPIEKIKKIKSLIFRPC
jgi:hypothetical protein